MQVPDYNVLEKFSLCSAFSDQVHLEFNMEKLKPAGLLQLGPETLSS